MTSEFVQEAALTIAKARREGAILNGLPEACKPASPEDGYAVQAAFIDLWDDQPVGWKVGATAAKVQELFGLSEPFFGPVFKNTVFHSPATPEASQFQHLCLESEFAFRFARDLPTRDRDYTRGEIIDAVEVLIPAMELISPRFDSLLMDAAPTAIADCAINGGLVLGTPCLDWRKIDIINHSVRFSVDGALKEEGAGARVLGDPVIVLEWLVNKLCAHGLGLQAGDVVSTGTCTGFHYVKPGEKATADFGDLGEVSVQFG